jgi:hypothetical protein
MATELQPRSAHTGPLTSGAEDVDEIRCQDCGASYPAVDGPAMLYALKSPCLHCGGDCRLAVIDGSLEQVA